MDSKESNIEVENKKATNLLKIKRKSVDENCCKEKNKRRKVIASKSKSESEHSGDCETIEKDKSMQEELEDTTDSSDNEKDVTKLKYKCPFSDCNQCFRREKDLDKHEFQHNGVKKYICSYSECHKRYRLRAHLKRHIQTYHEKKSGEITKEIECEVESCNRQFANKYSLNRHLKEFHGKIRKFSCPECDRIYERKNHLKLHLVTHTKEYPHKCYKCQVGFVSEAVMKRHNCSEHVCDDCDEIFDKWSALIKHRREKHQPLSYNCDKCDQVCKSKQELKIHYKTHKEKQICPWEGCTNSYLDRRNLKNHINVKHLGQKFKCTVEGCDKELSSKSKLNYHLRLHEKPQSMIKQVQNTNRKKRKDLGKSKKSMVGVLANFVLKPQINQILKNNVNDVVIANYSEHDTSETDGEDKSSKQVQLEIKIHNQ